ncbi:DUF3592 domain-containing protein [Cohaesibacter haloalkalitolerans]|uniref:DUF3592 domain-containing protein n=1 Tax=Cohaesibacter haloalkalitolerans TaxID=1162980 RepID=UPI000E65711A|nr:DUF3592 domain-containing protein [Cohaesibacter haloalkalitolerans]
MRYQSAYHYPGSKGIHHATPRDRKAHAVNSRQRSAGRIESFDIIRFSLIMIGLMLFIVGLAHFSSAHTIKGWDQREVTITRADVVRMPYKDRAPVFTAKIEYQFVDNGKLMTGHQLSLMQIRSKSPGQVKRQIAAYSIGRTVLAHVNPQDRTESFLKTNPLTYVYALIAPGLVLMFISLMMAQIQYWRTMKTQRRNWRFGEFNGLVPQPA